MNDTQLNCMDSRLQVVLNCYSRTLSRINFIFMSFGLISNTLSILIFSTKALRKSKFNVYLLILAIIELNFCLTIWIDEIFGLVVDTPKTLSEISYELQVLFHFMSSFLDSFAIMITLILSIDRYYAILRPLRIKDFITTKNTKLSVLLGLLVCLLVKLIAIPLIIFKDRSIFVIYETVIAAALLVITPAIAILVLNTLLIIKINNYDKTKQNSRLRLTRDKKFYEK